MAELHEGQSAEPHLQVTLYPVRTTPLLPVELVAAIMRSLARKDLRNMAACCRQYKATAYQHAGLSLFVLLKTTLPPDQNSAQRIAACCDILRHALKYDLRLDLRLHFSLDDELGTGSAAMEYIGDLCASISEALPVLVALTIAAPDALREMLDPSLQRPAPYLRTLSVLAHLNYGVYPGCPGPATIFAGSAPKLHSVELNRVLPGDLAIPAFAAVRNLQLTYDHIAPLISISPAFPAVRELKVICAPEDNRKPTLRYNLDGLALDKLVVFDDVDFSTLDRIEPLAVLHRIPVVVHDTFFPDWWPSFWPTVPGHLSMRIADRSAIWIDTLVTIVTEGRVYMRVFEIWETHGGPENSSLRDLGLLAARFAYIRLDYQYLEDMFTLVDGFPALRRLQIDVRDNDDWIRDIFPEEESDITLCPVLEDLVIFAMQVNIQVRSDDITPLAEVLGLHDRETAHAVLTLVGVNFADGEDPAAVAFAFPRIVSRPFTGRGSPDDLESGFWEY
ncbi:hypothetical protein AURDEDRAFT_171622 [Auricularia subglabra TFB-10046 SS5]|nr:hypothetical protein AURDEDRAFT_171622 [Auricularia subglabra TFB-10046 SS5]